MEAIIGLAILAFIIWYFRLRQPKQEPAPAPNPGENDRKLHEATTNRAMSINQQRPIPVNQNRPLSVSEKRAKFNPTFSNSVIEIDDKHRWFRIKGVRGKFFNFEDLVSYELNEDEQAITSGGLSIGRAIVGSVFSPAGMIIGGVTGDRKAKDVVTNMHIGVAVTGEHKGYYRIPIINSKTKKTSRSYTKSLETARETLGMLDIISFD